jgi:mannosyltransferase
VTGPARQASDPVMAAAGPGPVPAHVARTGVRRAWMPVLPGLATFAVCLWGIGSASFWRDEAATLSATRRPLPDLAAMLAHVDAVHGLYYLLMWPLAHVAGTGELAMRLPSAAAMACAACGVAACGRRLGSTRAGLCAGLVFAVLPMTSRYGQEARSYPLVTAAAVLASYLLVRVLVTPGRRWLVGYGLSLALLGVLSVFALLIVPAHAVTLVTARPRRAVRGWLAAAAAAAAVVSPVAVLEWRQRAQIAWLLRIKPSWPELYALITGMTGSAVSLGLIAALGTLGALRGARGGGRDGANGGAPGDRPARRIVWLGAPWLIIPPALLFAVSEIAPTYQLRYVVFCLPAAALLAGCGLAALNRYVLVAVVALLAFLALPAQRTMRQPAGHGDDIRTAAQVLRAQARPADAVIYDDPGTRTDSYAYPYGFAGLRDVSLLQSPAAARNLGGAQASPAVQEARLRATSRVWVIEIQPQPFVPPAVAALRFRLVRGWQAGAMTIWLYERGVPLGT